MELEPEPEVLGDVLSNVVLPNGKKLVMGSDVRCPRGIWDDRLDEYRIDLRYDAAAAEGDPQGGDNGGAGHGDGGGGGGGGSGGSSDGGRAVGVSMNVAIGDR